jgi:hypothetical protein
MDSSSDNRNNQRNDNNRDSNDDKIKSAVAKIFKEVLKNGNQRIDIAKLGTEYGNIKLADEIQKAWVEKNNNINKKAKKFAQLIRDKYSNTRLPFHIILEKARLFKMKYSLSDDEFAQFQRIYEEELIGLKSQEVLTPATNMMKVLGNITTDIKSYGIKELNDQDTKTLQDIMKLHASSRALHAQVLLQSFQYEDCAVEALSGMYRREQGHRPGDSIHPVIAALFMPKIQILDEHFLHSNISSIVKSRFNGEPLSTKSDYELFYSLINDPNDIICDNKSSVLDLYNRIQIQNQLWDNVLNLRNGQYYGKHFRDFIGSIDMCKLNKYDTPDLIYGRYDGTVLKRLISAFSFRPTVVTTLPIYQSPIINMNPYQQNIRPLVTSVSMINLKLPPVINDNNPIDLSDSLQSEQFFLENGVITPRSTSIIYSRGVLFFYIDRRTNIIRPQDMQPFNISRLPLSVTGFERLNDRPVNFQTEFKIREDVYQLRSVVLSEVNNNTVEKNMVVGSSAIFMLHPDNRQRFIEEFFIYDPIKVTDKLLSQSGNSFTFRDPVRQIQRIDIQSDTSSFEDMAHRRGIIFMYQLVTDNSQGIVNY